MFLRSGIESVSKVWFHLLDWLLPDHSYDHLGPDFGTNEVLITYSRRLIATRGSFMLLVISVFSFPFSLFPTSASLYFLWNGTSSFRCGKRLSCVTCLLPCSFDTYIVRESLLRMCVGLMLCASSPSTTSLSLLHCQHNAYHVFP